MRLMRGFSLLEVALAVLLLGLFTTWLLGPGGYWQAQQRQAKADAQVQQARELLAHYLQINRFLPCPDTDGDGLENRDGGDPARFCAAAEGGFPYRELGLARQAGYDRLRYVILPGAASLTSGLSNVHDICHPASVFGRTGAGVMTNLYQNPDSLQYFCGNAQCTASLIGSAACTPILSTAQDPRRVFAVQPHPDAPPYFHTFTPPVGSWSTAGMLKIYDPHDQSTVSDDELLDDLAVAVVMTCPAGQCMAENTDGDVRLYHARQAVALQADRLAWLNLYEVKRIMVDAGIY